VDSTDHGPKGLFRTQREQSAHLRGYESGKRALLRCVQVHLGRHRTALTRVRWIFTIRAAEKIDLDSVHGSSGRSGKMSASRLPVMVTGFLRRR
jgi:hypothetical protein